MLFTPLQLESVRSPSGPETPRSACWGHPRRTSPTFAPTVRPTASRRTPRWTPSQPRSWSPTADLTSVCCCSRCLQAWRSSSARPPESVISWREWLMMTQGWARRSSSTGACLCFVWRCDSTVILAVVTRMCDCALINNATFLLER